MAFKCFDCCFYHLCTYAQVCIDTNHSSCGMICRECENCRFGSNDGTGWINCTKPGQNIRKKFILEHESKIFEDFYEWLNGAGSDIDSDFDYL